MKKETEKKRRNRDLRTCTFVFRSRQGDALPEGALRRCERGTGEGRLEIRGISARDSLLLYKTRYIVFWNIIVLSDCKPDRYTSSKMFKLVSQLRFYFIEIRGGPSSSVPSRQRLSLSTGILSGISDICFR